MITAKVPAGIPAEPALKVSQIGMTTIDGEVTLSRTFDSQLRLERVAEVTHGNHGVKSMENSLAGG